jgi:hypothetical protein
MIDEARSGALNGTRDVDGLSSSALDRRCALVSTAPQQRRTRPSGSCDSRRRISVNNRSRLACCHRDVAEERAEQADVHIGFVVHRPVEVIDSDDVEEPRRLDLRAIIRQLSRRLTWSPVRKSLTDGVIHLLNLVDEGVTAGREDVRGRPGRQVPSGRSPRQTGRPPSHSTPQRRLA